MSGIKDIFTLIFESEWWRGTMGEDFVSRGFKKVLHKLVLYQDPVVGEETFTFSTQIGQKRDHKMTVYSHSSVIMSKEKESLSEDESFRG